MKTIFELPVALKNYQLAYQIRVIVVGCGGTGGYLVPNLARLIANTTNKQVELILLDGDQVESKNLLRQNFIQPDLGRHKAEVLAERYSSAFGMEIHYHTEYLKDLQQLETMTPNQTPGANIVIGCVDNHRTRQILAQWFRKRRGRIWLDAGNEEMNGQVVCGYNQLPYEPGLELPFALPCVADLFPEIEEDTKAMFNDELSCAERAEENPQNIATNLMAANYLLGFAQQVILGNPLHSHGVFFSAERCSADTMLNVPSKLSSSEWKGYKSKKQRSARSLRKARRRKSTQSHIEQRLRKELEAA